MRKMIKIIAVLFVLACSSIHAAEEMKLEPNAKLTFEFCDLPETFFSKSTHQKCPAMVSAQLPENYTPDGKFPLFVFLNGGDGGRGDSSMARYIVGPRNFVTVSLPLFKDWKDSSGPKIPMPPGVTIDPKSMVTINDAAILGSSYKVMLQKLLNTVPNITVEHSTFGGFSNGAHATAALIAGKNEFILGHFTSFFFFEGGMALVLDPTALQQPALKHCRFISILGDYADDPSRQAQRKLIGDPLIETLARQASDLQIDFTWIVMHGYGHTMPQEYQKLLGQWVRGERLPDNPAK